MSGGEVAAAAAAPAVQRASLKQLLEDHAPAKSRRWNSSTTQPGASSSFPSQYLKHASHDSDDDYDDDEVDDILDEATYLTEGSSTHSASQRIGTTSNNKDKTKNSIHNNDDDDDDDDNAVTLLPLKPKSSVSDFLSAPQSPPSKLRSVSKNTTTTNVSVTAALSPRPEKMKNKHSVDVSLSPSTSSIPLSPRKDCQKTVMEATDSTPKRSLSSPSSEKKKYASSKNDDDHHANNAYRGENDEIGMTSSSIPLLNDSLPPPPTAPRSKQQQKSEVQCNLATLPDLDTPINETGDHPLPSSPKRIPTKKKVSNKIKGQPKSKPATQCETQHSLPPVQSNSPLPDLDTRTEGSIIERTDSLPSSPKRSSKKKLSNKITGQPKFSLLALPSSLTPTNKTSVLAAKATATAPIDLDNVVIAGMPTSVKNYASEPAKPLVDSRNSSSSIEEMSKETQHILPSTVVDTPVSPSVTTLASSGRKDTELNAPTVAAVEPILNILTPMSEKPTLEDDNNSNDATDNATTASPSEVDDIATTDTPFGGKKDASDPAKPLVDRNSSTGRSCIDEMSKETQRIPPSAVVDTAVVPSASVLASLESKDMELNAAATAASTASEPIFDIDTPDADDSESDKNGNDDCFSASHLVQSTQSSNETVVSKQHISTNSADAPQDVTDLLTTNRHEKVSSLCEKTLLNGDKAEPLVSATAVSNAEADVETYKSIRPLERSRERIQSGLAKELETAMAKVWAKFDDHQAAGSIVDEEEEVESDDESSASSYLEKIIQSTSTAVDYNTSFDLEAQIGNDQTPPEAQVELPVFANVKDTPKTTEVSDDEATIASTVASCGSSPVSFVEFSQARNASNRENILATTNAESQINGINQGSKPIEPVPLATPNDSRLAFLPKLLAVDLWSDSGECVQYALEQFASLCASQTNITDILKYGGHLCLSVVLRKWSESAAIQATALSALQKAADSMEFSDAIVQLGALDLVLVAMKNHSESVDVLSAGCGALLNLTVAAKNARILVFELNGISTVCAACAAYPSNVTLQKYALYIIQYFSYWEDFKAPLVKAGGMKTLATIVEFVSTGRKRNESPDTILKSAKATMQRLE